MDLSFEGDAVQGWQGLRVCPGQKAIRQKADGLRWSDKARLPQEGSFLSCSILTPSTSKLNFFLIQAKTTKKITIRLECKECKAKKQLVLKRCKHFEIGEKKKGGGGPSY